MRAQPWQSEAGLLGLVGALAVVVGLAACGGGSSAHVASRPAHVATQLSAASEEPRAPASPGAVVARVGPYSITGVTFDRAASAALSGEPAGEKLVPPDFSACVAHLQGELAAIGEHVPAPSQITSECQTRYQTVLQGVLERLIWDDWLIGGASELGVPISGRAPTLEARAKLASDEIRTALQDRVAPITQAQVASYYGQHRFGYLVSGERDLEIARTMSKTSAAKVRAEIESGKSFASVVKRLRVQQPVDSGDGSVLALQPHVYGEPNLNEAIFTAKPHVLNGPIDTWFGYFVFEVTKIDSEVEKPLKEVNAAIRQQLLSPLQQRAFEAFKKQWIATWTARTNCSAGDVVPKCRQFQGVPVSPPEASTLN